MARRAVKRPPANPSTSWRRLPLGVGLLAAAVAGFHAFVQVELIDEGVLNMGAWRITEGQVPYRDFFAFYTPGSFYFVALAYKLFGVSLASGRLLAWLLGVGLVAATASLAMRLIKAPLFAAVPVAVLCQAGLGGWPFASHHWIADAGCVLSAGCALRSLEERTGLWSALSGAAASIAFWSLSGQGALMSLLLIALYLTTVPRPRRRDAAVGWAAGWAVVALPFLVVFAKVDAATLRYDLLTFPTTAYKAIEGNRYAFTFPVQELLQQWSSGTWRAAPVYTAVVTATSLGLWLAPVAAAIVLAAAYVKRWDTLPRRGIVAALGVTFLLTVAWRWAPINLQWTAVGPALVIAWALARSTRRWSRVTAWVLIGSFAFVGAYRIVKLADPNATAQVRAPAGTWRSFNLRQAAQLQQVVDEIGTRLTPGEPLLCKMTPLVNFMTLHPNPTRLDLFVPPGYTPDEQTREVMATADRIRLRWILTPAFVPSGSLFDTYLLAHYELAWDNGEFGLWRRLP